MAAPKANLEILIEKEWENSRAKVALKQLLESKLDQDDKGKNVRANLVYKMKEEFWDFPQKFFTKKLQNLRKPMAKGLEEQEPDFEDIVLLDMLEEEWENSPAKASLERLVAEGQDKKDDGNNQRADAVYKLRDAFKHFPSKFVAQKLQKLRQKKAKPHENPVLNSRVRVVLERIVEHGLDCKDDGNNKPSDEVFKMRDEFKAFPSTFFTQQLKDLRKGKPKVPSWKNSRARSILEAIILVGYD
jgi:hypothetical protein